MHFNNRLTSLILIFVLIVHSLPIAAITNSSDPKDQGEQTQGIQHHLGVLKASNGQNIDVANDQELDPKELKYEAYALEKNFIKPDSPEHPLDVFQLTSQAFNNDELETIGMMEEMIQEADPDGEYVDTFLVPDSKFKRHYKRNLIIQILDENEKEISRIHQADVWKNSTKASEFNSLAQMKNVTFNILDSKGVLLHKFFRPIKSIGFYGDFLVYQEVHSFDHSKNLDRIRFIDLDQYKTVIGNSYLPVFTMPMTGSPSDKLYLEDGFLKLGNSLMDVHGLKLVSQVYGVFFNLLASWSSAETQRNAFPVVAEMFAFFKRSLELAGERKADLVHQSLDTNPALNDLLGQLDGQFEKIKVAKENQYIKDQYKAFKSGLITESEYLTKYVTKGDEIERRTLLTNRTMQVSKLMLNRLHLYIATLARPQIKGGEKLLSAMIKFVESSLKGDKERALKQKINISLHPYFKYVKYGSFAVGSAAIGGMLPEPYTFHLYMILDFGKMLADNSISYLDHIKFGLNFVKLYHESYQKAFAGISGVVNYFAPEVRNQFAVGFISNAMIPVIALGVSQITVNSIKVYRYMKEKNHDFFSRANFNIEDFKKRFIEYQENERIHYAKLIADIEEKKRQVEMRAMEKELNRLKDKGLKAVDPDNMTPEERLELDQILARVKGRSYVAESMQILKQNTANYFRGISLYLTNDLEHMNVVSKKMSQLALKIEGEGVNGAIDRNISIDTFGKAFRHFLLSYPSLTHTLKFVATTWNYIFLSRSFSIHPGTWYMALVYPHFFDRSIRSGKGFVMPSLWNGGERTTLATLKGNPHVALEDLKRFEKEILPIEKLVYEESLKKAIAELLKRIDRPSALLEIFDSTFLPSNIASTSRTKSEILSSGDSTLGFSSMIDPKIKSLSAQDKAFFRAYFTRLNEASMSQIVSKMTQKFENDRNQSLDASDKKSYTQQDLKTELVYNLSRLQAHERSLYLDPLKPENKKLVVETVDALSRSSDIVTFANNVTNKLSFFFERKKINFKHDLLNVINPVGSQINRFLTVERMREKADMMAMAARTTIANMMVSQPMALMTLLVFNSAVTEGLQKPFYPEQMNGPESFLYMSRYLILHGWVAATLVSMMASTWMELQMLDRFEKDKALTGMPMKHYREMPFWKYYFVATFKNPKNSWLKNQILSTKLIWANIPAYLVMEFVIQTTTMGRFEIGAMYAGYVFTFLTPFLGFNPKLEMGFKIASRWINAQVPLKYRNHPEAISAINAKIQAQQMKYNFFQESYAAIVGTANALFENMNSTEFGNRAFTRLMLHGWSLTELMVLGLRKTGDTLSFIPGFSPLMSACEFILTNGDKSFSLKR